MVGPHWFVHPVENGIELVIDSTDGDVYDRALAEFVAHFLDYELIAEWSIEGGEVLRFVPVPMPAPADQPPTSAAGGGHLPTPRPGSARGQRGLTGPPRGQIPAGVRNVGKTRETDMDWGSPKG